MARVACASAEVWLPHGVRSALRHSDGCRPTLEPLLQLCVMSEGYNSNTAAGMQMQRSSGDDVTHVPVFMVQLALAHAELIAATQSVAACAVADEGVSLAFSKVLHMVAPPESLFSPRVLVKVLLFRLRRLLFGQGSRQAGKMA